MKPFLEWTIEEVEETFQLVSQKNHPILKDWLTVEKPISVQELETFQKDEVGRMDSPDPRPFVLSPSASW